MQCPLKANEAINEHVLSKRYKKRPWRTQRTNAPASKRCRAPSRASLLPCRPLYNCCVTQASDIAPTGEGVLALQRLQNCVASIDQSHHTNRVIPTCPVLHRSDKVEPFWVRGIATKINGEIESAVVRSCQPSINTS